MESSIRESLFNRRADSRNLQKKYNNSGRYKEKYDYQNGHNFKQKELTAAVQSINISPNQNSNQDGDTGSITSSDIKKNSNSVEIKDSQNDTYSCDSIKLNGVDKTAQRVNLEQSNSNDPVKNFENNNSSPGLNSSKEKVSVHKEKYRCNTNFDIKKKMLCQTKYEDTRGKGSPNCIKFQSKYYVRGGKRSYKQSGNKVQYFRASDTQNNVEFNKKCFANKNFSSETSDLNSSENTVILNYYRYNKQFPKTIHNNTVNRHIDSKTKSPLEVSKINSSFHVQGSKAFDMKASKNPLGLFWPKLSPQRESVSAGSGDCNNKTQLNACSYQENCCSDNTSNGCDASIDAFQKDNSQKPTENKKIPPLKKVTLDNEEEPSSDKECSTSMECLSDIIKTNLLPAGSSNSLSNSQTSFLNSHDSKGNSTEISGGSSDAKVPSLLTGTSQLYINDVKKNEGEECEKSITNNMKRQNNKKPSGGDVNEIKTTHNDQVNSKQKLSRGSDQKSSPSHNERQKKKPKKDIEYNTYFIGLNLEDSFDNQAACMVTQFEMTPRELAQVNRLKADLLRVFSPIIPDVEPVLFGSVIACTAFKYSDVDIYLQCYDSLPMDNVREFIARYGSAIYKGGLFSHVVKITNARVPIIKAIHNHTRKNVDVAFMVNGENSHFGFCNSLLIKHLCSHDSRVRNLIMLILFWAKCHCFVGKYQMSSFTFILMAIFYLQIQEVLPPLHRLIKVNDCDSKWPTTFDNDIKHLINNNTESLESLYLGFFEFYSAVRFDEVVISVYAGELVPSISFDSLELLPSCYAGYKQVIEAGYECPLTRKDMCIQEPFNMSWNTISSVNPKVINMLKQACLNVCNVFAKFSSKRVLLVVHSDYQPTDGDEDTYSWLLPCPCNLNPVDWFKKVVDATRTVFSDILLMDLHNSSCDNNYSKFCKFYLSDVEEENPIKIIVSCKYLVTTKERNKMVKAYQSKNLSEFDKEVKASSYYLEVLKKKAEAIQFDATIYIIKNDKNGSVEVSINKCGKNNKWRKTEHKSFVTYLKNENFKHLLKLVLDR